MDIALAIILHPSRQEVLIARRRKGAHLAEFWEFPGGKIESGETAAHCAVREAREETGLEVKAMDTVLEPVSYDYPERSVMLYPILCQAGSLEAKPLASDAVRWVRLDELNDYAFPPANAAIIAFLKNTIPVKVMDQKTGG